MQNLAVPSTQKKGHFKFMGKIRSVTGKVSVSPALTKQQSADVAAVAEIILPNHKLILNIKISI